MRSARAWLKRLVSTVTVDPRDDEIAEELAGHLQLHIDDNLRAGMTPAEARRHALLALGGVEATKERYRERRRIVSLEHIVFDLRLAARALWRRRMLSAAAVVSIAIGAGINLGVY